MTDMIYTKLLILKHIFLSLQWSYKRKFRKVFIFLVHPNWYSQDEITVTHVTVIETLSCIHTCMPSVYKNQMLGRLWSSQQWQSFFHKIKGIFDSWKLFLKITKNLWRYTLCGTLIEKKICIKLNFIVICTLIACSLKQLW